MKSLSAVRDLISAELGEIPPAEVASAAEAVRKLHGDGVAAVLFYGACRRADQYDGGLLDFYVVVEGFHGVYANRFHGFLNWLLPPNVYFLEISCNGVSVRAKYAVLSARQFAKQTASGAFASTLWGRLCQPCTLVWARDDATRKTIEDGVARSVIRFFEEVAPLFGPNIPARNLWIGGLKACYGTEFRSEHSDRQAGLYEAYAARYDQVTDLLRGQPDLRLSGRAVVRARWLGRRMLGRTTQVLRLFKAVFTFANGLDYVLYKIEKHSGVTTTPSQWQQRHPILAAPKLAWTLYRKGAFR
jgi:hypothetical protein